MMYRITKTDTKIVGYIVEMRKNIFHKWKPLKVGWNTTLVFPRYGTAVQYVYEEIRKQGRKN